MAETSPPTIDQCAETLLLQAVQDGTPLVLFLGQSVFAPEVGQDPVLTAFAEHLGRSAECGWRGLLRAGALSAEDLHWLSERFCRFVQHEGMQDVLDIMWSAVFTTSLDRRLALRLRTRGRQPEPVLAGDHFARVSRSRSRPPVYFLFGLSDEEAADTRAPRSSADLLRRFSQHSIAMLNRAPDTATALGTIVVDGFRQREDWLQVDQLFAALSTAHSLRLLWFGAPPDIDSELATELIASGVLVTESRRLAEVVASSKSRGLLDESNWAAPDEPGIVSLGDDRYLDVSPALRLRVEASASIVDDSWTTDDAARGSATDAEAFYQFHGELGGVRRLVEGVGRGFAITREFESALRDQIAAALRQSDGSRVLIIHGQSGTGKTVALARLAHQLRRVNRLPVVIATDRVPLAVDLDDFCNAAEQAGTAATAVLCDANQPPQRYADLAIALRSKGRRVIVVGTSYRMESQRRGSPYVKVEAPADVTRNEREQLVQLVNRWTDIDIQAEALSLGNNILALVYRIIAVARVRIATGVSAEARAAEAWIRERARSIPAVSRAAGQLAVALVQSGVVADNIVLFEDDDTVGQALGSDTAGRIIDYVMAIGRLNCSVPMNLLLRALNSKTHDLDLAQVSYLFRDLDIFRWKFADREGTELLVSPRLQLEAELICRRRLGDRQKELVCIVDIVEAVRPRGVDRDDELSFLLELLQKLGREGPRGDFYSSGYLQIGQSLTALRLHHQVRDASVMLQESSFRRAALRTLDAPGHREHDQLDELERYRILNEAREAVEAAIQGLADGSLRGGRRTRENLLVERASIYGFLAVGRAKAHGQADAVWSDYLSARAAASRAMAVADSYFPFDVALWTPVDILDAFGSELSLEKVAEIQADIYAILDQVDPDRLPDSQFVKFQLRRNRVSKSLSDGALGEDALSRLDEASPSVAHFLRARALCPDVIGETGDANGERASPFSDDVRRKALAGAEFLRANQRIVGADLRCLQLLVQFQWAAGTGYRLFHGDRRPLPHQATILADTLATVTSLNEIAGDAARFVYRYLEAVLAWVSNDQTRAIQIFRRLSAETEYEDASRVVRRLFVGNAAGQPVAYVGRLERKRTEGHWQMRVEGIQGTVDVLERDFRADDLQPGRQLRDFTIAFNYLGPIADPLSRYGGGAHEFRRRA